MATSAHSRRRGRSGDRIRSRARAAVDLWVDLFDRHNLLTYASAIALQTFVAAIAFVLLGLGLLGVSGRTGLYYTRIAPTIHHRLLPQVSAGVDEVVRQIFAHDSSGLVVFACFLAIWEVSGSVRACMGALTRVYDGKETRPWWIRFPISFGIAIALAAALLGAILLLAVVRGPKGATVVPFEIMRWLLAFCLVELAFGLLVRFGPAERRAKRWASVGAGLVVIAWIAQTLIFSWYVSSIANFKTAVGSLLVVLVVTSYFYVGAIVLLIGIELDELLRKDAKSGERGIGDLLKSLF